MVSHYCILGFFVNNSGNILILGFIFLSLLHFFLCGFHAYLVFSNLIAPTKWFCASSQTRSRFPLPVGLEQDYFLIKIKFLSICSCNSWTCYMALVHPGLESNPSSRLMRLHPEDSKFKPMSSECRLPLPLILKY